MIKKLTINDYIPIQTQRPQIQFVELKYPPKETCRSTKRIPMRSTVRFVVDHVQISGGYCALYQCVTAAFNPSLSVIGEQLPNPRLSPSAVTRSRAEARPAARVTKAQAHPGKLTEKHLEGEEKTGREKVTLFRCE